MIPKVYKVMLLLGTAKSFIFLKIPLVQNSRRKRHTWTVIMALPDNLRSSKSYKSLVETSPNEFTTLFVFIEAKCIGQKTISFLKKIMFFRVKEIIRIYQSNVSKTIA